VDAILFGSGMDVAHVIMPNGKDAMLRVGDEVGLNHGRVKQIRDKEIVIEEIYVDPATRDIHIIEKTMKMK
jgi:Tfp pilus assembly protein PilP